MLGISGAPEHIEGMKDAELIIAINTDETAPIFEHAHFGTTEDLFEVVPALTAKPLRLGGQHGAGPGRQRRRARGRLPRGLIMPAWTVSCRAP